MNHSARERVGTTPWAVLFPCVQYIVWGRPPTGGHPHVPTDHVGGGLRAAPSPPSSVNLQTNQEGRGFVKPRPSFVFFYSAWMSSVSPSETALMWVTGSM